LIHGSELLAIEPTVSIKSFILLALISSSSLYWTLDRKKLAESNKKDQKFLTQDEIKKLRIFYSHGK